MTVDLERDDAPASTTARRRWSRALVGYAAAVALLAADAGLRTVLSAPVGRDMAYVTLVPLMALAAIRWGVGPGAVVCIGANLLTVWLVKAGHWHLKAPMDWRPVFVSLVCDAVVLWLCASARRAWAESRRHALARDGVARTTEAILESIPGVFYALDREFRFSYVTASVERWAGVSRARMVGRTIWEVFPQLHGTLLERRLREVMSTGVGVEYEAPASLRPDTWCEVKVAPTADGLSVYFRDVTERKRVADALEAQDALLRLIADAAPMFIGYVDVDLRYRFANRQYAEWFGRPLEEIRGATIPELMGPDNWEVARPHVTAALSGQSLDYQAEFCDATGQRRWMHASYTPDRAPDGSMRGAVVVVVDETARRRAEEEVARSEERYRGFIQTSSEAIWRCEADAGAAALTDLPADEQVLSIFEHTYLAECNDAMARLYGFESAGQFAGARMADWLPPSDPKNVELVRAFVESGYRLTDAESHQVDRAGQPKVFLVSLVGVVRDGRLARAWGTLRDVTEQRRVEAAIREGEQRLRLALDAGQCGVWEWNVAADAVTWSDRVYDFHGLRPGEFGGRAEDFTRLIHPDDRQRVWAAIGRTLEDGTPYHVEFRATRPDGTIRWLSTNGRAIFDPATGKASRLFGATIDVTDRKAADEQREQLLASERAARAEAERANRIKDEFLATLSHELRTPLNAILGWAQLLQSSSLRGAKTVDPEDLAQGLETIDRNARVQARIIDDLLDMSRIMSGKLLLDVRDVDLGHVLAAAVESVRAAAEAKGIALHKACDVPAGACRGDAARLQQVVWNLLNNAIKFTPRGGNVSIRADVADGGDSVRIDVTDDGQGIRPEFLPHVFERFRQADASTTRRHGGLGLGLSIVKQLAEMHGGTIAAHSDGQGLGARFTVTLPAAAAVERREAATGPTDLTATAAPQPADPSQPPPTSLRGVRVLVVDDEPDALELLRRILEDSDAHVRTAASAREGLELLRVFSPDVLVSDIGMPDQDGYEFIRNVRATRTALPAAALTALARAEDRAKALVAGYQVHVPKPVQPATLVATVAELAGRKEG